MTRIPWNERQPGHFEVDLVHSGPNTAGAYIHTLQMVDVATGWSERIAVWGHSCRLMQDAFTYLQLRLPFPVRQLHPDNGSEFFNDHLHLFWQEVDPTLLLSHSRPYHKNDNRFVEQKNSTLVRAYLGDDRFFDSLAQLQAINRLYEQMWLYYNLLQPVIRLTEKELQPHAEGRLRQRRRYDAAQTPLAHLPATDVLPTQRREQLLRLRDQTNLRQLREAIYNSLDQIFTLPGTAPGRTEDVFQTLTHPINTTKGEGFPVTLSLTKSLPSSNIFIWLDMARLSEAHNWPGNLQEWPEILSQGRPCSRG
jgi:hypothetical protein